MLKKPALDWIGLDCGNLDQIVLAQRCIVYLYPHINSRGQQEDYKLNLLSYLTSMNTAYYNLVSSQGVIFSLKWELVYKTGKISWT